MERDNTGGSASDPSSVVRSHLTASWYSAGKTDTGLVRAANQDALMLDNPRGLWLVADGMGGRAGGDVASKLAVQWIHDHFQSPAFIGLPLASEHGAESISLHLVSAIRDAGLAIRDAARTRPGLDGLGTTIVATAVSCLAPLQVVIVHVGDSRAYLFRDNMLRPLTRDHSLVEDLLAKGQIAPAEAASHPQRHILLRALGIEGQMEPDIHSVSIEPSDVIFLCTDGITKMLNEDQIAECLRVASQAPDEACELLIKEANALGGKDNSTAVVVRFW